MATVVLAVVLVVALVTLGRSSDEAALGLAVGGAALLALGVVSVVVGRARWALIASRRAGLVVAAAGLAALLAGGVGLPTAPPGATEPAVAGGPTGSATGSAGSGRPDEPADGAPGSSTAVPTGSAAEEAVTSPPPASAPPASALAAVAFLEVKGRAPRTGYDRDDFGRGWVDVDRNGCDTRNDILARDLADETFKQGTNDCVVATGVLADPYSGRTILFQRGNDTSDDVQIDHVVALSDAWQKGAQSFDEARRTAFANDPLNLLAVDGPLNQQKSDGDAATWLPPNRAFRCAYVARQVAVKIRYDLWVTPAERDAMATVLTGCPDEPLPDDGLAATGDVASPPTGTGTPVPATGAGTPPPDASGPTVPFENCAAARAAGAAPVRRGQPGYGPHLDGNGDGVGCES